MVNLHLRVLRRAAGEYSLALRCAGEDTLLGGSLLQVAVLAAPVAVSRCRVRRHEQNHVASQVSRQVVLELNAIGADTCF
jgi:hypothetical protein